MYYKNDFRIFTALHEDTDKGWVYLLLDPSFKNRQTIKVRNPQQKGKYIYCEYRELDDRFRRNYNDQPRTANIRARNSENKDSQITKDSREQFKDVLVISKWYRDALGISDTTHKNVPQKAKAREYEARFNLDVEKTQDRSYEGTFRVKGVTTRDTMSVQLKENQKPVNLKIISPWCPLWADLRASCHHPEPVTRIAARLGILGVWLGVVAFLEPLSKLIAPLLKVELRQEVEVVFILLLTVLSLFAGRGVKP